MEVNANEIYTPKEAQKILKVSVSTMTRMIKRGLIKTARVGKQYRIMGKEILRVISPVLEDQVGKAYNAGRKWIHEGIDDEISLTQGIGLQVDLTGRLKNAGIIIQARMTSKRLPGKMLLPIEDKPVLQHLLERLILVVPKDRIVLATSEDPTDDLLEEFAGELGFNVFRGSLDDVSSRYYECAKKFKFDPVVRVTGDNILTEPVYLRDLFEAYRNCDADYVSAKNPQDFPRGTTAEIFSFAALENSVKNSKTAEDREHVTWHIRNHPGSFKIEAVSPRRRWKGLPVRLVLDEPQDFKQLRTIFSRLYTSGKVFGLEEISELYKNEPEIFEANKDVVPIIDFYQSHQNSKENCK